MAISAKDVMELRKQTDCGMMECKKALTEADGNFEKAIEILRERGLATAAKKASRTAAEGIRRSWKKLEEAGVLHGWSLRFVVETQRSPSARMPM